MSLGRRTNRPATLQHHHGDGKAEEPHNRWCCNRGEKDPRARSSGVIVIGNSQIRPCTAADRHVPGPECPAGRRAGGGTARYIPARPIHGDRLGVFAFHERNNGGTFLVIAGISAALMTLGAAVLSRSPVLQRGQEGEQSEQRDRSEHGKHGKHGKHGQYSQRRDHVLKGTRGIDYLNLLYLAIH